MGCRESGLRRMGGNTNGDVLEGSYPGWGVGIQKDRVQGTGCRLQVTGYGLRIAGYGLQVTGCRVQGAGYGLQVTGAGYRVRGTGYRVQVQGAGCRVQKSDQRTAVSVQGGGGKRRVFGNALGSEGFRVGWNFDVRRCLVCGIWLLVATQDRFFQARSGLDHPIP